jgi:hypothetical protein
MKYIIVFLVLLSVTTKIHGQENNNRATDEKALRYLKEVEWPKSYREQDTVLLDRILADEFKMIDSNGGTYTKTDELAYIKTHKTSYDSFKFVIKRLEIFENNTAIVSGTGIIRNHDKDGELEITYQSSNVFIKRGSLWKAISSHTSGDKVTRVK